MIEEFPFQKAHDAIVSMLHDYLAEKEHAERLEAENARLKAEVERLAAIVGADAIDREHGMCCDASAQVERLTKAGDVLANNIVWVELYRPLVAKWNAAKEGEQP